MVGYDSLGYPLSNEVFYNSLAENGNPNGWNGEQQLNFQMMLELTKMGGVPIQEARCLDVGCGTADFADLLFRAGGASYTGIDISEDQVTRALCRHDGLDIVPGDFLKYRFPHRFNYVLASGALHTPPSQTDQYAFLERAIKRMRDLVSEGGFYFNLHEVLPGESPDMRTPWRPYDLNRAEEVLRETMGSEGDITACLTQPTGLERATGHYYVVL